MENEGDSLTLGSLFDGIGGWQLAAVECGIKPLWSSEIDDFPMAVSRYHFPDTVQLGDITKINGTEIEPVDIICAGSPCQDLSTAGKREGLKGERSGLFMDSVRIVREMRAATNGEYPKWFVWENVPGAYSSNKGNDFRAVLEEITETEVPMPDSGRWAQGGLVRSPKCDVAWRTLDAQYWGVPQRRKRIFLVADFRAERRPEVLFESESMPWYPAESKEQGKGAARDIAESIGVTGFDGYSGALTGNVQSSSRTNCGSPTGSNGVICIEGNGSRPSHLGDGYKESDTMYTLNTTEKHAVAYGICSMGSNCMKSTNPYSGTYEANTVRALDVNCGNPACNQGGMMIVDKVQGVASQSYHELRLSDKGAALRASGGVLGGAVKTMPYAESRLRKNK